jgi:hypothetical protein
MVWYSEGPAAPSSGSELPRETADPAGSTYSIVCSLWTVWCEGSLGLSDWTSETELVWPGRLMKVEARPPFCARGMAQPVRSRTRAVTIASAIMMPNVREMVNMATLSRMTE